MGRKRKGRLVTRPNACNVSELCKLYACKAVVQALFNVISRAFYNAVPDNKAAGVVFNKVIDNFVGLFVKVGIVGIDNGVLCGVLPFKQRFNRSIVIRTTRKKNARF